VARDRMTEFWGLDVSVGAVCGFFARHGFAWRMEQAKAKAADRATKLPKDFEAKKRAALAQREFEAAYQDLSIKETIALRQLEQDERILQLKERIEPEKLKVAQRRAKAAEETVKLHLRRIELLETSAKEAKDKLTAITASKGGLTPETLKQIEEAAALL